MHRFLHGIRRSSCWPVASPLAFARLTSPLPFTILKQPCGYGDLLPNSGVDDEGVFLPQSGDANEDGDLLPYSGEVDGEGIPPSQGDEQDHGEGFLLLAYQSGESAAFRFSTLVHEGKPCVEEGILLPAVHVKACMLSSTEVRMLLSSMLYVFDPGGDPSLHEQDVLLYLLLMGDFDPGGHLPLPTALFPHAPHNYNPSNESSFATLSVATSPTPSSILFILFNAKLHAKLTDPIVTPTPLRGSLQEDATSYDCSLWLNSSNSKEGADAYFLIPLRGSNSVQWNDEDFDEDVAALKMMTKRRMMVLWLLYLMKDLLDPG